MKSIGKLFGGGKPKPDKQMNALQRRQMQDAANERAALEAEKADVSGGARRARSGRALLSYARQRGKTTMGV
jgi:hypothetical protein